MIAVAVSLLELTGSGRFLFSIFLMVILAGWLATFLLILSDMPAPPKGDLYFFIKQIASESSAQVFSSYLAIDVGASFTDVKVGMIVIPTSLGLLVLLGLMRFARTPLIRGLLQQSTGCAVLVDGGTAPRSLILGLKRRYTVVVRPAALHPPKIMERFYQVYQSKNLRGPIWLPRRSKQIVVASMNDLENLSFLDSILHGANVATANPPLMVCIQSPAMKKQAVEKYEAVCLNRGFQMTFLCPIELSIRRILLARAGDYYRLASNPNHLHIAIIGSFSSEFVRTLIRGMIQQVCLSGCDRWHLTLVDDARARANSSSLAELSSFGSFVEFNLTFLSFEHPGTDGEQLLKVIDNNPMTGIYVCRDSLTEELSIAWYLESLLTTLGCSFPPIILTNSIVHSPDKTTHLPKRHSLGPKVDSACAEIDLYSDLAEQSEALDLMARHLHDDYVFQCLKAGESLGIRPSLQVWGKLPELYKSDNRALADHFNIKLRDQGLLTISQAISARLQLSGIEHVDGNTVECLASAEHSRWWVNRIMRGWTYGITRNDTKRVHPDMVPWLDLTEEAREKDRAMIRQLPRMAGLIGMSLLKRHYVWLQFKGEQKSDLALEQALLAANAQSIESFCNALTELAWKDIGKQTSRYPVWVAKVTSPLQAELVKKLCSTSQTSVVLMITPLQNEEDQKEQWACVDRLRDCTLQIIEESEPFSQRNAVRALDNSQEKILSYWLCDIGEDQGSVNVRTANGLLTYRVFRMTDRTEKCGI